MAHPFQSIPWYEAAYHEAARLDVEDLAERSKATLRLPHYICGLWIRPMTARDWIALESMGNTFVCSGFRRKADAAQFLWYLSLSFMEPGGSWFSQWRAARRRAHVINLVASTRFEELAEAIEDYIDRMMADCPRSDGDAEPRAQSSFAITVMDLLGEKYGWSPEQIEKLTLPEVFQLFATIRKKESPTKFGRHVNELNGRALAWLNTPEEERE